MVKAVDAALEFLPEDRPPDVASWRSLLRPQELIDARRDPRQIAATRIDTAIERQPTALRGVSLGRWGIGVAALSVLILAIAVPTIAPRVLPNVSKPSGRSEQSDVANLRSFYAGDQRPLHRSTVEEEKRGQSRPGVPFQSDLEKRSHVPDTALGERLSAGAAVGAGADEVITRPRVALASPKPVNAESSPRFIISIDEVLAGVPKKAGPSQAELSMFEQFEALGFQIVDPALVQVGKANNRADFARAAAKTYGASFSVIGTATSSQAIASLYGTAMKSIHATVAASVVRNENAEVIALGSESAAKAHISEAQGSIMAVREAAARLSRSLGKQLRRSNQFRANRK